MSDGGMVGRIAFSQLWVEEQAYLHAAAAALPPGAVVIELGTAQGGSAYLFADATRSRGCTIYSYDLAPSSEARRNLAGTGVHLIAAPSTEGAARWPATCGRPIDLLFIDASHTLANVFADYHAWIAWLAPGGRVLFHDYDRPERGGVAHLGVRVFLDALLAAGVLREVEHVGRVLGARVDEPTRAHLPEQACADAWRELGRRVVTLRGRSFAGWRVLAPRDRRSELVAFLLGVDPGRIQPRVEDASDPVVIVERPLSDAGEGLLRSSGDHALLLDDLAIGYLVIDALRARRDGLLERAADRGAFFKWEEYLEMLDHADPEATADPFAVDGLDLEVLSRRCARELLRLSFAERIANAIIGNA